MKYVYLLVNSVKTCETLIQDLKQQGVLDKHLHVIANRHQELGVLPKASIWQKTDLAHGIKRGIKYGSFAGLLGAMLVLAFPLPGLIMSVSGILICVAAGAGVGTLMCGLIKYNVHNQNLDAFKDDLVNGDLLLLVSSCKNNLSSTISNIVTHHPMVRLKSSSNK